MGARYAAPDYQSALWGLMPRGRVWAREPGSTQDLVLGAFAPAFERSDERAVELLADAFPETTDELLPDWESTLGLPDPCAGPSPTLQQRRAQVGARFTNSGGQSANYFIDYAARLGFEVTITQYTPFRAGAQGCGSPLGGADWVHVWSINAPETNVTPFRVGQSAAGEPLQAFGNAVLECELRAIAPAHTILTFLYR